MDSSFLLNIIEKAPAYYGVAIVVSLIPIVLKTTTSLIEFYENVHLKRFFNRIKYLADNSTNKSEVSNYLECLKCNEVFRIASGIRTYPEKSKMLMKIFELGIVENKELKSIQGYLNPSRTKIKASLNNFERIQIIYSCTAGIFLMLMGVLSAAYFQFGKPVEALFGILMMFVLMLFGGVILKDFRRYRTLVRVTSELKKMGELSEAESNIRVFSFLHASI
ncbi:hypothetical protein [Pseudoalteromonas luteoviolacea]|uniref:hypothetical protein n=1 Tax=Pseudoalteromonas luteoviolacea TaxID=43657 RepID=UPI001B39C477|nr:hypothetical protein [Pseudoalteromonas luteoviolacea]MBQ4837365.1 hypothetical protein [Pseudoalteromonas luteoviolacea]